MPGRGCQARKQERKLAKKQMLEAEIAEAAELGLEAPEDADADDDDEESAAKRLKTTADAPRDGEIPVFDPGPSWVQVPAWIQVPALEHLPPDEGELQTRVFYALYEAVSHFGNAGCTYPQLAQHPSIIGVKASDPSLENVRVHDFVKRHSAIFELTADSSRPGGWLIQMRRGLMIAYPDLLPPEIDMTGLPDVIAEPSTDFEKLQALRILFVRSLFKRGGQSVLHDLGQDPDILELKKDVLKSMAILKFLRCFPANFGLTDMGNGNFTANLQMVDTDDLSPLEAVMAELSKQGSKGKGKDSKDKDGSIECREFLRGSCTRGDSCRYSHGDPLIPPAEPMWGDLPPRALMPAHAYHQSLLRQPEEEPRFESQFESQNSRGGFAETRPSPFSRMQAFLEEQSEKDKLTPGVRMQQPVRGCGAWAGKGKGIGRGFPFMR